MSRCRNTLQLLRTQLPHRSIFTGLASLPSASHSISNPSSSSARGNDISQPTATSSKYTLDHPFWFDRPEPAQSALAFATDDELFQALLLPAPAAGHRSGSAGGKHKQDEWTATFDPALAFLALRSRPTYTAFLQCVHPFFETVYPRLKAADQHQLLVSDLLLRHPDPRLLRDLLELDSQDVPRTHSHRNSSSNPTRNNLRPSLVASIYSIIAWQIRRGSIAPLSFRAHLLITRSIAAQKDYPALIQSWHDLRARCPVDDKETSYTLLSFVLLVARSDAAAAFGMLHLLVKNEKLPQGILLRGLGDHPRRREMLVLGAVIGSCLQWNMQGRARKHAGALLDLILDGKGRPDEVREAVNLILDVCRGAEGALDPQGLEWCTKIFFKMASVDRGPSIPGPLFDAWLESVFALPRLADGQTNSYPLDTWLSLPSHRRPPISAQNILRLASATASHEVLLEVLQGLFRLDPSSTLHIATPLLSRIDSLDIDMTHRRHILNTLLHHWAGSLLILRGSDLTRLVRDTRADRIRCLAIMKTYEARLLNEHHRRGEISTDEALAMVQTYLLVLEWDDAEAWMDGIDLSEDVKWRLREMGLGDRNVRLGLKHILRKRCKASEVKKIIARSTGRIGR